MVLKDKPMNKLVFVTFIFSIIFPFILCSQETKENGVPAVGTKKNTVVIKYDPENKEVSEFIPLKSIDYQTVEQFCRPMLSETGTMGYMPEKNCVVVHDFKKNTAKIREFVESAASQLPDDDVNVRVEVEFKGAGKSRKAGFGADLSYPEKQQGKIIIQNGKIVKPERINIDAYDNSGTTSSNTTQFIVTRSGFPARIWAGKRIADPSWMNNYRFIPLTIINRNNSTIIIPGNDPDIVWSNVGAYLYILPKYLGDGLIDVEVFPAVSYLDGKRREKSVRVESVSTRLTVKSGQKINIGGIVSGKDSFYRSLFGPDFINIDNNTSLLDMWLTATVQEPGASIVTPRFGR